MEEAGAIRMRIAIAVIVLGLFACQNEKTSMIKETINEARKKARVNVQIRLASSDFPTSEELALRRKLEADIEREHIGAVLDAGSGSGFMDFTVEVDDTVTSIPKIRALVDRAGLLNRSTIKVVSS